MSLAREKIARETQAPWMSKGIIGQLQKRDLMLKLAKRSASAADWKKYKSARNKVTNMIKTAKYKFYKNCFENQENNPKGIWKTIKSLMGNDIKNRPLTSQRRKTVCQRTLLKSLTLILFQLLIN